MRLPLSSAFYLSFNVGSLKVSFAIIVLALIVESCDGLSGKSAEKKEKSNIVKAYFKDGSVRAEIPTKNKKKHGLAVEYYLGGGKFQEIEYKEGIKDGVAKKFYEDGQLAQETHYIDGKMNGIQQKFRENGKLSAETMFYEDEPCKGLKEYLLDGSLKKNYPQIQIQFEDRLFVENVYVMKLTLTDEVREVEFFTGQLSKQKTIGKDASKVWNTDRYGYAEMKYTLLPGQFMMERVNVIAKIKTNLANYYITEKTVSVAADHR